MAAEIFPADFRHQKKFGRSGYLVAAARKSSLVYCFLEEHSVVALLVVDL